jgi:signal transduction histidine kinase
MSAQAVELDIDVILGELDRLARISDRLVSLARADGVRLARRDPIELGPLAVDAIRRWRATGERDWGLDVQADGSVPGDRDRIDEALDALIENAINATRRGDCIGIRVRPDDSFAVIEVADSGKGIPTEDLDRVFDRFWRGSSTGRSAGTGLGLAIVRSIANAHGGSAEVKPNDRGGVTFRIRLPGFRPAASTTRAVPVSARRAEVGLAADDA